MKMLKLKLAMASLAAGLILPLATLRCPAQTGSGLPPGAQDVVKLVKAGLSEEVVVAHIKGTGLSYNLSADQIIELKKQGVSDAEIKAMLGPANPAVPANPAPAPPPAASTPPAPVYAPVPASPAVPPVPAAPLAQTASLDAFRAELAPFGTWMDVPGYGLCWRPAMAVTDPYWRPYCDQGHWVYTADGWFWQSDYPWGDIVFHYGRWYRDSLGWVWVPGNDWAPAWVCWRKADNYCGWAPLPPNAVFKAGVGLWFGGRVAVDVDFGLRADLFTFVAYDHFWDHNLHAFLLPRDRVHLVFGRSVVMNGYRLDRGRFVVEGPGRARMASLTHREVVVERPAVREGFRSREGVEHRVDHGGRGERHER